MRNILVKIEAVIYDLDGTLVDSEPQWHQAETEMLASRGYVYRPEVRAALLGKRLDGCIRIIREAYQLPESEQSLRDELLNRMMLLIRDEMKTRPGADELLDTIHNSRLKTAIASSSPLSFIQNVVKDRGWEQPYFPPDRACLFSADDVPEGKPAPDVYLVAAASLGVNPETCIAIEDSTTGARAAVAAGMTCIVIWDSFESSAEDFADITPHCFSSLSKCLPIIRQWIST